MCFFNIRTVEKFFVAEKKNQLKRFLDIHKKNSEYDSGLVAVLVVFIENFEPTNASHCLLFTSKLI